MPINPLDKLVLFLATGATITLGVMNYQDSKNENDLELSGLNPADFPHIPTSVVNEGGAAILKYEKALEESKNGIAEKKQEWHEQQVASDKKHGYKVN